VEGILAFLGFSFGASLGVGAVRMAGGGPKAAARELIRAGLAVGEAVQSVANQAVELASDLAAEAEQTAGELRDEARDEAKRPRSAASRRRTAEPRRIQIARE